MDMWPLSYAQMPDYQIAVFPVKETLTVRSILLALSGRPDLQWITTDPIIGPRFRPNNHSIRTLIKRTVLGHKHVWDQVGGKPPLLNLDQLATVQAIIAEAEQLGGIDTRQISETILQMRRESISPALLNMIRFLNSEKLGGEEANADDTRSTAWLKYWLQKHDMRVRAPEPIRSARWRYGHGAMVREDEGNIPMGAPSTNFRHG
jgi:hypothetical protein